MNLNESVCVEGLNVNVVLEKSTLPAGDTERDNVTVPVGGYNKYYQQCTKWGLAYQQEIIKSCYVVIIVIYVSLLWAPWTALSFVKMVL